MPTIRAEENDAECSDSPHQVSPAPIRATDDPNYLDPKQSASPFEFSEEFDTPDPPASAASPNSASHSATHHELDSLDSLHLPSDVSGDLTFTLNYNYQARM